jgi:hypothetical protein
LQVTTTTTITERYQMATQPYYLTTDHLGPESTFEDVALVAAHMRAQGYNVVADETGSQIGAECPVSEDEFWALVNAALGVTLSDLADELRRDYEAVHAPGSETSLWGEFCEDARRECGVLPYSDDARETTVSAAFAEGWRRIYAEAYPEVES